MRESTDAFVKNFLYVKVNSDLVVGAFAPFALENLVFLGPNESGSHSLPVCDSQRRLLYEFSIFSVKVDLDPEVDSACSFHELLMWRWVFRCFSCIFSHSVQLDVELSARLAATFLSSRWSTVVGRRGLPCCAAVFLDSISTETSSSISRPLHNLHNLHDHCNSDHSHNTQPQHTQHPHNTHNTQHTTHNTGVLTEAAGRVQHT